jgi:hypothetical protein
MELKKILALSVLLAVAAPSLAQEVTLAPGHPQEYVVVKGDTLWDITGRFLERPWLWPEVWQANPQIENPHLIYPGDVVSLHYRDGKPVLTVRRGGPRPVVRLSPQVRSEPRDTAIPTIPLDAVSQFLTDSRVVSEGELESAPYVVSLGRERLMGGGAIDHVYVRGRDFESGERFAIYRQGALYRNPQGVGGEVLGREAVHVADVVVERVGDPATVRVTRAGREIQAGDRLMPLTEEEFNRPFVPRSPPEGTEGSIVSVVDGVTQIGRHQVVVLNLGSRSGIEPGHVLAVHQKGDLVEDRFAAAPDGRLATYEETTGSFSGDLAEMFNRVGDALGGITEPDPPLVALPDERAGLVMVFRAFDRVSYALVMESSRAMHIHDRVTAPE